MMTILGILAFILWLWALIDILKNEFRGNNKIIWIIVVILLPVVGFILYYLIGREQRIPRTAQ